MEIGQQPTMQSQEIKKIEPSNFLKIKISPSNITLVLLKHLTGELIDYFSFSFEELIPEEKLSIKLRSIIKDCNINKSNIISVEVFFNNKLSCIIPETLFDEKHGLDYLKYNAKLLKNDITSYDNIEEIDAVNVYLPYTNVNNFLIENYGAFNYYHYSTLFIKKILKLNTSKGKTNLYINFDINYFQISIIKNNDLVYFNTFNFNSPEDALYYILYNIKQNKINTSKSNTVFFGKIKPNDKYYKLFLKFIKNIKIQDFDIHKSKDLSTKKEDIDFLLTWE